MRQQWYPSTQPVTGVLPLNKHGGEFKFHGARVMSIDAASDWDVHAEQPGGKLEEISDGESARRRLAEIPLNNFKVRTHLHTVRAHAKISQNSLRPRRYHPLDFRRYNMLEVLL